MAGFDTGLNTGFTIEKDEEEEITKKAPIVEPFTIEEDKPDEGPIVQRERSVTSIDKTGIRAVEAQQDKVLQSEKEALTKLSELDAAQSQQAQEIQELHNQEVNALNQAKIESQEKFNQEIQAEMSYIDAQRERLANTQPKSFWANKDTDDKLAMGIAVLMSSIGAGMTSNRSDSGTDLLGGIIAKDLEQKEKHLNRQITALDKREMSMGKKAEIHSKLLGEFDAHVEQSLAIMRQKLEKVAATTKDAKRKSLLQQEINKLDQDQLNAKMATEQNIADRVIEKGTIYRDMEGKQVAAPKLDTTSKKYKALDKPKQDQLREISKKSATIASSMARIDPALEQLNDPNLSVDDKQRVGRALLEDLVSTGAVQAEEAQRYGAELIPNWGKVLDKGGKGAAGGVVIGSAVPGVGTTIGAITGGAAGAISGLVDALNDPGGLKFSPDPEGFARMVTVIKQKNEAALRIADTVEKLMLNKGMSLVEAQKLATIKEKRRKKGKK